MGKSSASAPNVIGAAKETGEQARYLQREQTMANRPNQVNPWGSTTWERTPIAGTDPYGGSKFGSGNQLGGVGGVSTQNAGAGGAGGLPAYEWTQIEQLNPQLQAALDAQLGLQRGRSELAGSRLSDLQAQMGQAHDFDQYGNPVSFDPAEQRKLAEDAAYGRSTSRLDPQWQQKAKETEIALRNKGLRPGDQAYDSQMATFNQAQNDAYEQARMGATLEGRSETQLGLDMNERANALRSQQIQEDLFARGFTLDEINRLMQGQEIEGSTPSSQEKATIADQTIGG